MFGRNFAHKNLHPWCNIVWRGVKTNTYSKHSIHTHATIVRTHHTWHNLCMTWECRFIGWACVQWLACDGLLQPSITAEVIGRMKSHVLYVFKRSLTCTHGEVCLMLMSFNRNIANMAHFYDTDGPCIPTDAQLFDHEMHCVIYRFWLKFILLNTR